MILIIDDWGVMKNYLILILLAFAFIGCSTIKPKVTNFEIIPNTITAGERANMFWDIETEDSVLVYITDVGIELPLSGERVIYPIVTKDYELKIFKKDKVIHTEKRKVYVVEKNIEPEKEIIKPQSKDSDEPVYLQGVIDANDIGTNINPEFEINLIDANSYPKKISLYCTVKDEFGNHIANLAPPYNNNYLENWKSVVESMNGEEIEIEDFKVKEFREDGAPPFAISFVMDYSGSMIDDYPYVNEALKMAVEYLRPAKDVYEVVQFDTRVLKSVNLTNKKDNINSIIPFSQLGFGTAFYSATNFAIESIKNSNKERVLILFTDGADNSSLLNAYDIIVNARKNKTKVFIIGFQRQYGAIIEDIMKNIAEQTGGKLYFPQSIEELDDIFTEIFYLLKVYYVITYSTTKSEANIREVTAEFEFPNSNLVLSASKNYYVKPEVFDEGSKILTVALFDVNKSEIIPFFQEIIKKAADFLKQNPHKKIKIYGHTDNFGDEAINIPLSNNRARAVADLLRRFGVSNRQITDVLGLANEYPIYPEEANEIERLENRRVEIEFISQ